MSNRTYHHGNLPEALVSAGVELARTGGPAAVVLRAASRAAGVSHNAAYRHYADREDLLAAVAARCMDRLGSLMVARMEALPAADPVDLAWARLDAIGRAYIEFATTEHGWFRTAFSGAAAHGAKQPVTHPGAPAPYTLLADCLDGLVAVGALPAERRPGAEYAAWSAVHGLSDLLVDGPLRELPPQEVAHAVEAVLTTAARGL
ncbi:TetR/AcrR family transcriptional regulator [Kitasatospora acidiphila]|uniref:TetR/AcrR family transcriptional regulator n=1 Tax=Kitasatospora acidiphila TaxID=2567942 RepID=UPI003C77FEA5